MANTRFTVVVFHDQGRSFRVAVYEGKTSATGHLVRSTTHDLDLTVGDSLTLICTTPAGDAYQVSNIAAEPRGT